MLDGISRSFYSSRYQRAFSSFQKKKNNYCTTKKVPHPTVGVPVVGTEFEEI
jgi:hypothetical protein